MSDEELVKRLRDAANGPYDMTPICAELLEAADRIEQLVATNEALTVEREWFEEEWVSAVDKLNKAVELAKEAIETMASGPFFPDEEEQRLLSKLAEIEGERL